MAEHARAAAEDGAVQPETALAHRHDIAAAVEHLVRLLGVVARRHAVTQPLFGEEPHAIQLTAARQHGEEARHRAGVGDRPAARKAGHADVVAIIENIVALALVRLGREAHGRFRPGLSLRDVRDQHRAARERRGGNADPKVLDP